jgi:hypothetical protein
MNRYSSASAILTMMVLVGHAPAAFAQGSGNASHGKANDVIVIQPKSHIRNVGALREKVKVVRGQDLIGRSEFEISCSIGAAYAHIPGEEKGFRFSRQSDCKDLLKSDSATSPCRSQLAVNRQTKTVSLIGKACGAGPFSIVEKHENQPNGLGLPSDRDDADSLSQRARDARLRARGTSR